MYSYQTPRPLKPIRESCVNSTLSLKSGYYRPVFVNKKKVFQSWKAVHESILCWTHVFGDDHTIGKVCEKTIASLSAAGKEHHVRLPFSTAHVPMEAQSCNVNMYTPVRLCSAVSLLILVHFRWPCTQIISFWQNQLLPECTVLWNIKCLACKTSNVVTVLSEVGSRCSYRK